MLVMSTSSLGVSETGSGPDAVGSSFGSLVRTKFGTATFSTAYGVEMSETARDPVRRALRGLTGREGEPIAGVTDRCGAEGFWTTGVFGSIVASVAAADTGLGSDIRCCISHDCSSHGAERHAFCDCSGTLGQSRCRN